MMALYTKDPLTLAALPLNVAERFDGAALWPTLTPERQAEIGAAALDLVAAWTCVDAAEEAEPVYELPLGRVGEAAETDIMDVLMRAVVQAVPPEQAYTAEGQPRIPARLGLVCVRCGCSENDACLEGCTWAADSLCTSCADRDGKGRAS